MIARAVVERDGKVGRKLVGVMRHSGKRTALPGDLGPLPRVAIPARVVYHI
jgi:hypothetical protein